MHFRAIDQVSEVEGRFSLAELQLQALIEATNALSRHLTDGQKETKSVLSELQATLESHESLGETQSRRPRTRRKSGWAR